MNTNTNTWLILDLDNCLADDAWRRHHLDRADFNAYHSLCGFDRMVNKRLIGAGHRIAIFTGRSERFRAATEHWLFINGVRADELFMRRSDDHEPAAQMKRAMLNKFKAQHPEAVIVCAYDDREDVVAMYRNEELRAEIASADEAGCAERSDQGCFIHGSRSKSSPDEILAAMAETFRERNAVYGDNWRRVGAVMMALFPDGTKLSNEQEFNTWHLFELLVVKLTRFTNSGLRHKDSIHDIAVYAAMLESMISPPKDKDN